ncbi:MAG: dTDP-glucose 4,6-dehydratase [Magnetococcales bacterium]|nr:dTDP-glucose 4,6-dehydratase [Magnetococcales bacterium]HIJ82840.1 NAD-dependent epimerase/dehydratase family protein [Magnetococcales bacterium]
MPVSIHAERNVSEYLNYYKGKTILVTGGAGAIGSNLCKKLGEAGARMVIILDNLYSSYTWNIPVLPNILFVRGDITNDIDLKRVFTEKPDVVFHLAAFFANQNSIDYPERDLHVNGMGSVKLLEYATLGKISRFVYASSGCSIYGSAAPLPLTEEFMSMNLSSPYQITKMLGELYCNFYFNHFELPVVKARFFNSYGPGEVPGQYRNVIPNFLYWGLKGETLPITGTGEETRDFTYVTDLVDGLLRAGYYEAAVGEDFNLASGAETKIVDLANKVVAATGGKSKVTIASRRKWDTKSRLLASVDKARRLIGYEPKVAFDEGFAETIAWFRDKWDLIERDAAFTPGMSSAVKDRFGGKG